MRCPMPDRDGTRRADRDRPRDGTRPSQSRTSATAPAAGSAWRRQVATRARPRPGREASIGMYEEAQRAGERALHVGIEQMAPRFTLGYAGRAFDAAEVLDL